MDLYGNINPKENIVCCKNDKPQKFDILIKIGNTTKRISLKKGFKNSVHSEPISEFVHFLIQNGLPKQQVIEFLKYHYADGSTNGKGNIRLPIEEYKKSHQKDIDKINEFINKDNILKKSIKRFITSGRNSHYEIDAIIYGIVKDFIWIKKEDIYKLILSKKNIYNTSIHFGPLVYQPMNRNIINNEKYESKRYVSQIKWYNIVDDIIEYTNNSIIKNANRII